jgi:hypothetical protein
MMMSMNLFSKVMEKVKATHQRITYFHLSIIPLKGVCNLPILVDITLFGDFTHKKTQVEKLGF